jgi:sulfite reductase (ferredoxin)
MPTDPQDRSAVEATKEASRQLRGDLVSELADGGDVFSGDGASVLKFHGIYQQDDRDVRRDRKQKGLGLAYRCMIRTKIPGGAVDADQYLALDRLADEVGDGTLRVTTRQDIQYHFVHKADVQTLVAAVNRAHLTTFGACGDVVRNVVCCPAPLPDGRQHELLAAANELTRRLLPRTEAYWELWVDGERAATAAPTAGEEPLYGTTYLPRKFKIGIAWPGDNCIDLLTQDFGAVPAEGPTGEPGFVVFAGGGLGQSHADEDTYPRLADPFAWIPVAGLADVAEAVVTIHRDFGNRKDRKHARLKYVIDERGLDWFLQEVARRVDVPLYPPVTVAPFPESSHHLGWHDQADGRLFVGVPVANGRIRDVDGNAQRRALREVVERFRPDIRFTARQDILLTGLLPSDRPAVEAIFRAAGSPLADDLTPLRRLALACPALPTCGQALAEAERVMPEVVDQLETALTGLGVERRPIDVRMTGCPNGCARPYTAEIGIVGRTKRGYDVYVGGSPGGDRLARQLARNVKLDEVVDTVRPLLEKWRSDAAEGEPFGDFWARIGLPEVDEPVLVGARGRRP